MPRRGATSFLERNQRVIGFVSILLVGAGTVLALLLQGGFFTPTYAVTALFSDGAGIRSGDYVTVAGLPGGKVKEVRLEGGSVAIELAVEDDVRMAADSSAEIVIETLLGRKSVALIPGRSDEPLRDGAVIPLDRTTTPIDITELNDISVRLLNASDAEGFDQMLREITEITEGKAQEVQTIIAGLDRVTAAVDRRQVQLTRLIESLRILSTTFGQRDRVIVSLIDNLDVVLDNLAERQEDLVTLLHATDASSHETANLVERNRTVLDSALNLLHQDLEVLDRHQLDLAATIAYLDQAVQGYSSVGYSQGTPNRWANIFVQSLGPAGVDALVGPCGTVDQFFDHYFGSDCATAGEGGPLPFPPPIPLPELPLPRDEATEPTQGGEQGTQGQEAVAPTVPALPGVDVPPPETPGLPCSIGDLVGSTLPGAPQGCEGG
ncbi:MAG: MCE family protein [Actinomycetota bacterium]